ncbi:hypothetical protein PMAYCL1PPCAC_08569, partial [Pristionchus mayeri]
LQQQTRREAAATALTVLSNTSKALEVIVSLLSKGDLTPDTSENVATARGVISSLTDFERELLNKMLNHTMKLTAEKYNVPQQSWEFFQ